MRARREEFDVVLLSAVWMHLDEAQRRMATQRWYTKEFCSVVKAFLKSRQWTAKHGAQLGVLPAMHRRQVVRCSFDRNAALGAPRFLRSRLLHRLPGASTVAPFFVRSGFRRGV